MDPLEIVNRVTEQKLKDQVALMRQLYTAKGFFEYWFTSLPKYKSNAACFRAVNDMHEELFGVPKYSEYNHFIRWKSKYLKQS